MSAWRKRVESQCAPCTTPAAARLVRLTFVGPSPAPRSSSPSLRCSFPPSLFAFCFGDARNRDPCTTRGCRRSAAPGWPSGTTASKRTTTTTRPLMRRRGSPPPLLRLLRLCPPPPPPPPMCPLVRIRLRPVRRRSPKTPLIVLNRGRGLLPPRVTAPPPQLATVLPAHGVDPPRRQPRRLLEAPTPTPKAGR